MSSALISCIIPTFNGERYLGEALESIMAQSYRPLEIIVADDGSTDGTRKVVDKYGDRVRYLSQPNKGPASTRNLGLAAARGRFVAFLDQDDLWHPEKLTRQIARFASRPELDICVTHLRMFWDGAPHLDENQFRGQRSTGNLPGYITGTLLARRELFETVGFFEITLRYGDAMGWFLRAMDRGVIIELLPDVLLYHRMHQSNLSRLEGKNSREEFLAILKASLDRKRGRPVPSSQ